MKFQDFECFSNSFFFKAEVEEAFVLYKIEFFLYFCGFFKRKIRTDFTYRNSPNQKV